MPGAPTALSDSCGMYVDDMFGVVAYNQRDPASRRFARAVIERLAHNTYHPNLILKEEPAAGWFPFLEALLRLTPTRQLDIRSHAKNFNPLCQTGVVKFLTIQHRTSFMSRRDVILKIYGALHRLRRTVPATSPVLRVVSVLELMVTYLAQGYTSGIFCAALRQLTKAVNEPFWTAAAEVAQLLRI